jgi:hypothetical protein
MKFSRSDLAVSASVLLGAAALMYLFVGDLNAVSNQGGGKVLGTVVFKKLFATRKASNGFSWERMRNDSPVYDADTLRTADYSEATIYFDDGTSLDMSEDSMLKLDLGGKTKRLQFLGGRISLGSGVGATSYTISSSAGTIHLAKGAKATFSRKADTLSVEVSRGSASLVKKDGSTQDIAQNQELQVDMQSGKADLVFRPIVPVSPEQDGRLLSFAGPGTAPGARVGVDFAWLTESAPQGGSQAAAAGAQAEAPTSGKTSYSLELSQSKDFGTSETTRATGLSARVELAPGTWYWRVRDSSGEESPSRSFLLDLAEPPHPAYPPDGRRYSYRRLKPEIRFAWTGMDEASSYLFELASEPSFAKPVVRSRTTTTSLAVDSLGEGTWYWRVSPVHAFTVVGEAGSGKPAVRSFTIAESPAMAALSLTAPIDASLYQIQDASGTGLDFSWEPNAEAVSYELVISKAKDLSSPTAKVGTAQSYVSLSGEQAAPLARPGSYYWGARWFDREGNASPLSASRSLRGIDGSIAVHLSFPPDGYRIADSLVSDTRFAWKSNLPARTVFQLARDSGFKDLAYQETVSAETLIGHSWPSGEYHWRLCAYNTDGSVFVQSEPRSFTVVEPFASPALVKPARDSSFFLPQGGSESFSWTPVAGADYYNLTLSSAADNYATPIFEKPFVEGASLNYRLGDLPSGGYRLSIQAFATSGERTTRIIGYIGDNPFSYKRLSPIALASPADGAHLAGLDARKGRVLFSYVHDEVPDKAEIVVSTDSAGNKVVVRADARSGPSGVGRLNPGIYYWTVSGRLAGFDVSAKELFRFVVDPPPPPPPAALKAPLEDSLYRLQDLAGGGLDFSWAPQEDAASYEFLVSRSSDLSSPVLQIDCAQPSLHLSGPDAKALEKAGAYYWGLRWTNTDGDLSLLSPCRRLLGVDASTALRLSFPPEGYRIADSLVSSTPFSWKSDVPARTVFQLARDSDFKVIAYQETASGGSLVGRDWKSGSYYWRIRSYNADGSVFIDSQPRRFAIVLPFAAPVILQPAPGSSFYLRDGDAETISWTPVEGADYYDLSLRPADGDTSSAAFEKGGVAGTSLACPLGDLPEGYYKLTVQGFTASSASTTKVAGLIGGGSFSYKRLSLLKLDSPANGTHLPGLDARHGKAAFAFGFADKPEEAELVVSTDPEGTKVVTRVRSLSGRASVGRLDPGVYYWTVTGRLKGLDISARERYRLEVDQPPPLPAPEPLLPPPDAIFGPTELRQKRSITLTWKPVTGATRYRLAVYLPGKHGPALVKDKLAATSYEIDDLSVLDRGLITWSVEALSFDATGELEQGGVVAKSSFTIDLPALKPAKPEGSDTAYGR